MRVGNQPKIVGLDQFLQNVLVIVLDGADARRFEPALVAAHAMRDFHLRGVDDFRLLVFN